MYINAVEDVSKLSTIPEKTLVKLLKKFVYSICSAVEEDVIQQNTVTSVDIGLGIIHIKHLDKNNLEYRFTPNKFLEKSLNETLKDGKNPLENVLNDSLVKKLMNTYKDLC